MLPYTFRHLDGIGEVTERDLWRSGILRWEDLEQLDAEQLPLFERLTGRYEALLAESREALESGDAGHFAQALPSNEHYRILLTFPDETLFLDIETTGLSRHYDHITMIGWNLDGSYDAWIRGQDPASLLTALASAKVLVTFNGALFDVPFLTGEFPDAPVPSCHVDLRYLAARVGLKGGQKAIERELKLERTGLEDLQGENAPALWYRYTWGDTDAMERLVAYNRADVLGMKFILDETVRRLLDENGLPFPRGKAPRFSDEIQEVDLASPEKTPIPVEVQPYAGDPGPEITLPELDTPSDLRVVGIDLTGSEERGSGWCLLEGDRARTEVLHTDREILEATLAAEPDLVSIDSPLSLPAGRARVDDSDPARKEHGIMRECERALKRRGINVYPCLISSMQPLTRRGIELARELRAEGVPVIESYPGAAQDIMGIPRKGADEELLRKGLEAFGLEGDVSSADLNHDELDAVTSAVVGLFFWRGRFEPLGTPEEDYLIVPDLGAEAGWDRELVVGLSGPIAAGKTTAGRLLEEEGFRYVRYSEVLAEMAKERGLEPDRETLQQLGAEVYQREGGQRELNRRMIEMAGDARRIAVDGLRHPEDHTFLVEQFGPRFVHVFLEAGREERRKRYIEAGGGQGEFEAAVAHEVERDVTELKPMAHHLLKNESGLDRLSEQLTDVLT